MSGPPPPKKGLQARLKGLLSSVRTAPIEESPPKQKEGLGASSNADTVDATSVTPAEAIVPFKDLRKSKWSASLLAAFSPSFRPGSPSLSPQTNATNIGKSDSRLGALSRVGSKLFGGSSFLSGGKSVESQKKSHQSTNLSKRPTTASSVDSRWPKIRRYVFTHFGLERFLGSDLDHLDLRKRRVLLRALLREERVNDLHPILLQVTVKGRGSARLAIMTARLYYRCWRKNCSPFLLDNTLQGYETAMRHVENLSPDILIDYALLCLYHGDSRKALDVLAFSLRFRSFSSFSSVLHVSAAIYLRTGLYAKALHSLDAIKDKEPTPARVFPLLDAEIALVLSFIQPRTEEQEVVMMELYWSEFFRQREENDQEFKERNTRKGEKESEESESLKKWIENPRTWATYGKMFLEAEQYVFALSSFNRYYALCDSRIESSKRENLHREDQTEQRDRGMDIMQMQLLALAHLQRQIPETLQDRVQKHFRGQLSTAVVSLSLFQQSAGSRKVLGGLRIRFLTVITGALCAFARATWLRRKREAERIKAERIELKRKWRHVVASKLVSSILHSSSAQMKKAVELHVAQKKELDNQLRLARLRKQVCSDWMEKEFSPLFVAHYSKSSAIRQQRAAELGTLRWQSALRLQTLWRAFVTRRALYEAYRHQMLKTRAKELERLALAIEDKESAMEKREESSQRVGDVRHLTGKSERENAHDYRVSHLSPQERARAMLPFLSESLGRKLLIDKGLVGVPVGVEEIALPSHSPPASPGKGKRGRNSKSQSPYYVSPKKTTTLRTRYMWLPVHWFEGDKLFHILVGRSKEMSEVSEQEGQSPIEEKGCGSAQEEPSLSIAFNPIDPDRNIEDEEEETPTMDFLSMVDEHMANTYRQERHAVEEERRKKGKLVPSPHKPRPHAEGTPLSPPCSPSKRSSPTKNLIERNRMAVMEKREKAKKCQGGKKTVIPGFLYATLGSKRYRAVVIQRTPQLIIELERREFTKEGPPSPGRKSRSSSSPKRQPLEPRAGGHSPFRAGGLPSPSHPKDEALSSPKKREAYKGVAEERELSKSKGASTCEDLVQRADEVLRQVDQFVGTSSLESHRVDRRNEDSGEGKDQGESPDTLVDNKGHDKTSSPLLFPEEPALQTLTPLTYVEGEACEKKITANSSDKKWKLRDELRLSNNDKKEAAGPESRESEQRPGSSATLRRAGENLLR